MSKLAPRLKDASRSGVYRVTTTAALADAGLPFVKIILKDGKAGALEAIAKALEFPAWFGGNWDALEDCLSELKGSRILLFSGADALPADDFGILVDVLDSAATFHGAQGRPFFAVFLDPERKLGLPDLHREK